MLKPVARRELIKKRLSEGKKVGLHELLYPVMQGFDSFHMDTDIQLGGTDQTFNMQAGRVLQKDLHHKESFIIANGFLEGTDGRKMSKTWGNAIWLTDTPNDMFGKIMSLRDELIVEYFTLATNTSIGEIQTVKQRLSSGENPMILKKELARRIVSELHGEELAEPSQEYFENIFTKKDYKSGATEITLNPNEQSLTLGQLLISLSLVSSRSEFKRLLEQKAININNAVIPQDRNVKTGDIIKVGKRKFIKIV